jgi:predicted O-methyltransferase YrrM
MVERDYWFSVDWFAVVEPGWRRLVAELAGRPGLRFLEIGSFEGRSTTWMLDNILTDPSSRIDCVDDFDTLIGSAEHSLPYQVDMPAVERRFDHNIKASGAAHKVLKVKARSQEALRQLPLGAYDLIYVDGSHLAPNVLEDAVLSFPLLKSGGLLIFDDYLWADLPGPLERPGPAIDAFLMLYEGRYELLHKELQVFIRKR